MRNISLSGASRAQIPICKTKFRDCTELENPISRGQAAQSRSPVGFKKTDQTGFHQPIASSAIRLCSNLCTKFLSEDLTDPVRRFGRTEGKYRRANGFCRSRTSSYRSVSSYWEPHSNPPRTVPGRTPAFALVSSLSTRGRSRGT